MTIGIAAQAAFERRRTGVEEYAYQLINHFAMLPESGGHQFFLYVRRGGLGKWFPKNFILKPLSAPFFWTQGRLTLEMLFHKPDVLFIPGHVLPRVHPGNSIVTIHGLEFEYLPEMYPTFHQRYLRWATKYAASQAKKIIAVSHCTKDDLIDLYGVEPQKIIVVHHGVNAYTNLHKYEHEPTRIKFPYILFLGTKEKKKNISGLIRAFNLLKERYKIPHKLILAGGRPNKRFYKEERINEILKKLKCKKDIINLGFVSEKEKWNLLNYAKVFVYPSFYEGFGMPILEAQAAGVPVVTSNVSALPEVAGRGALFVGPRDIEEMAESLYKIIENENLRTELIARGRENVKRFNWEKCAKETLQLITNF